jgi:hypothetical protein
MIRKFIILSIGILLLIPAFSQNKTDTISYQKTFGGYKFFHNNQVLKPGHMVGLMRSDVEAFAYMKKARTFNHIVKVLGYTGGLLVVWTFGTAISGADPNWAIANVGAGLILLAFPLHMLYNKYSLSAIRIYNSNLKDLSSCPDYDLKFGLNSGGVGLTMRF